jgi:hypothetical protein
MICYVKHGEIRMMNWYLVLLFSFLKFVRPRGQKIMIILSLVFNPFNKGKGLWKFNNSLLQEKDYSKIVREKIIDLKKQYAALIYNRE